MKKKFLLLLFSTTMILGACSNATVTEETTPIAYSSLTDEELEKKVSKNDVDAILEKANRLYAEAEEKGEGYEKAVEYFKKAAEAGNAVGQYHLGFAYMQGVGVDTNMEEAYQWLSLSAEQGNTDAEFCVGYMLELGIGTGEEANYNKAFEFYKRAAEKDHPTALCFLGDFYYYGIGCEEDIEKAVQYYTASAEKESPLGQYCLGYLYEMGNGVEQDINKAIELYTASADAGYGAGQSNLAYLYLTGKGVEQDYNKAFELYSKSAEQATPAAFYGLGYLYQYGCGVTADKEQALEYYTLADNFGYEPAKEAIESLQNEQEE